MMTRSDVRSTTRRSEGFTLLELLVTVAIIGILAAIAIPMMSAYRERAYDGVAISDLRNAITAFEAAVSSGNPPPTNASELEAYGFHLSPKVSFVRFQVSTIGGNAELHIHTKHEGSPRAWHTRYPTDHGAIEVRGG